MATILIPVQGSEEVVEVSCADLPDDANDIVDILQAEMAPLDLWLKFAVEYYKQGKLEQFKLLLDPLVELEAQGALYDQFGTEPAVKTQFIAILNALAGYHMVGATRERDKQRKKAGFDQAKKYYDAADVIDVKDGRAMLGVAVLDLCQGQLVKAEKRLDLAAQFYHGAKSGNVPALLGAVVSKRPSGPARPTRLGQRPRGERPGVEASAAVSHAARRPLRRGSEPPLPLPFLP
jgi:RNA polymerase-associated protein CTR9